MSEKEAIKGTFVAQLLLWSALISCAIVRAANSMPFGF